MMQEIELVEQESKLVEPGSKLAEQEKNPKVAIRYCGGCNPRYDRGAMVERVCRNHPEWDVEIATEGRTYDLLLVVGGCPSCCAAYQQFTALHVKKIWTDVDDIEI
jgi:hypothetical protein